MEDESETKKDKTTDYAKTAKALGDIIGSGISISLVDINKSNFGFEPDVQNNQILFGMKALSGINSETIAKIISGRPYKDFSDFLSRCKLNKTQMISLIKAGAFDNLDSGIDDLYKCHKRLLVMMRYLTIASTPKTKLTLSNFNMLINNDFVPESLSHAKKVFLFNKYLKDNTKVGKYFAFDEACERFYNKFFDMENLEIINGIVCIEQKKWEKTYSREMNIARDWLKLNQEELLKDVNYNSLKNLAEKYANGNISAWEMQSLCFYHGKHELADIDMDRYGLVDFNSLPENPEVDYTFKRNNRNVPVFKTYKIIGTVISKNDTRASVTLLTTSGIVTVKFTKDYYAMFKRQISEMQENGKKKVMEKGWFTRGVKIMCTGFRREDTFVAKTYAKTQTHQIYKITNVQGAEMMLEHERWSNEKQQ